MLCTATSMNIFMLRKFIYLSKIVRKSGPERWGVLALHSTAQKNGLLVLIIAPQTKRNANQRNNDQKTKTIPETGQRGKAISTDNDTAYSVSFLNETHEGTAAGEGGFVSSSSLHMISNDADATEPDVNVKEASRSSGDASRPDDCIETNNGPSTINNDDGTEYEDDEEGTNGDSGDITSSVRVAVRIRPFLPNEAGSSSIIDVLSNESSSRSAAASNNKRRRRRPQSLQIGGPEGPQFTYDAVHPTDTTQADLYVHTVSPLVRQCLRGYNATVLAYGQTGSGKTHTILGPSGGVGAGLAGQPAHNTENVTDAQAGVIPRALRELFDTLEHRRLNPHRALSRSGGGGGSASTSVNNQSAALRPSGIRYTFKYEIRLQFLELYGEEVRDLLGSGGSGGGLKIRDNGGATGSEPEVVGASEVTVRSADEALICLARGMLRRVTGATAMNAESSRSHAIMTAVVEQTLTTIVTDENGEEETNMRTQEEQEGDEDDGETSYTRSKFHFVDLAGSERTKRTLATGQRLAEGININKGLLVLGNVISALGDPKKVGKTHVPYRDSKLTRLLRGSLGGNHRTLMVACVSPSNTNIAESINTLRYSNRARNIQNRAIVNVDPTSRLLGELRGRVKDLAGELLRVHAVLSENGQDNDDIGSSFSEDVLRALAAGGEGPALLTAGNSHEPSSCTIASTQTSSLDSLALQQRLSESDAELARITASLKRAKQESYQNEEAVYAAKAEAEYWKLKSNNGTAAGSLEMIESDRQEGGASVVMRMASYEREIARLKNELREAASLTELARQQTTQKLYSLPTGPTDSGSVTVNRPPSPHSVQFADESALLVEQKRRERQDKRHRVELEREDKADLDGVEKIKEKYLCDDEDEVDDNDEAVSARSASSDDLSLNDQDPSSVDVDDAATTASVESFLRRQSHMDAHLLELTTSISAKEDLMEQLCASQRRYESMREFYEGKLSQMAAEVEAREKEKEGMLAELLSLKSNEENDKMKTERVIKLKEDLKAKDVQIHQLRRRQKELTGLTQVPSRNEAVLARLKSDVTTMKRQKVDLQKKMSVERKTHLAEAAKLRKDAAQRVREASKWRALSERQKVEADKARNAAKQHVQEISKLRSKYRESEKRLRMQTLKKGVMQRVGLDPVLVGRRRDNSTRPVTAPSTSSSANPSHHQKKSRRKASVGTIDDVDIGRVRSFLDSKVADIGGKEAMAEKIAKEWEDHLELTERKNELLQERDGDGNLPILQEELEALEIQLKYREGRIRQLSKRLGNISSTTKSDNVGKSSVVENSFLGDKEYISLCAGAPPLSASQLTCKILFGMVVRERRRVASLARTAASLDERAAEAEKLADAREEALVSHVEEERHERAVMAKSQQEQIISLMSLVQEEREAAEGSEPYESKTKSATGTATLVTPKEHSVGSTDSLMVLSNETIAALERQVTELEAEREAKEMHRKNEIEARQEAKDRARELNESQAELQHLKSSLRQIRDIFSREQQKSVQSARTKENAPVTENYTSARTESDLATTEQSEAAYCLVDEIIDEALHPPPLSPRRGVSDRNKMSSDYRLYAKSPPTSSPGLLQESDSEDEEVPEWANDIMEDLSIIAAGGIPSSLKKEKKRKKGKYEIGLEKSLSATTISGGSNGSQSKTNDMGLDGASSVFDRLTAPENWTGAQKQSFISAERYQLRQQDSSLALASAAPIAQTKAEKASLQAQPMAGKVEEEKKPTLKKPVFDRLTDPSTFTGVQKQTFLSTSNHRHYSSTSTGSESNMDYVADQAISNILDGESNQSMENAGAESNHCSLADDTRREEDGNIREQSQLMRPANQSPTTNDDRLSPPKNDAGPRSVFDRLISPSNYTGTQKKVHATATTAKKRSGDRVEIDGDWEATHVIPTSISSPPASQPSEMDTYTSRSKSDDKALGHAENTDSIVPEESGELQGASGAVQSQNRERMSEYTQQNVFERLTKTVTASYAVKHQAEE